MKNLGLWRDRLAPDRSNPRERAFAAQWEDENNNGPNDRDGAHLVEGLLYQHGHGAEMRCGPDCGGDRFVLDRTCFERDRIVAATIIQWLGSNVGFDFLRCALERCGFVIIEKKELEELRKRAMK